MKVAVHRVESIATDVEAMQKQIANRAEELYDGRGGGQPLDDWLAAERETLWRPAIEVRQSESAYIVEAAVAGLEPSQMDVRLAPSDVLITANVHHHHRHTGDALAACARCGCRCSGSL